MSDFSLRAALCFDNEQGGLRCTRPRCYDARRPRVGRCVWRGGSRPSLAPMTKRKGQSPIAMEALTLSEKPMRRARSKLQCLRRCACPTGIVMVAPQTLLRNDSMAQI